MQILCSAYVGFHPVLNMFLGEMSDWERLFSTEEMFSKLLFSKLLSPCKVNLS